MDAWAKLIKYWKSPMAERESEQMQRICAMVSNPWKHGRIGVSHSMSLEVDFHSWLVQLLVALTSHFSFSLVLMWHLDWRTPKFLERFKCESESEDNRIRSRGTFPSS